MNIDLLEEYKKCRGTKDLENLREAICHFELTPERHTLVKIITTEKRLHTEMFKNDDEDYVIRRQKILDFRNQLIGIYQNKDS